MAGSENQLIRNGVGYVFMDSQTHNSQIFNLSNLGVDSPNSYMGRTLSQRIGLPATDFGHVFYSDQPPNGGNFFNII
jgi:hypothetical protein